MVGLKPGRSGHFKQTFLKVGVVLLVDGVEFLDVKLLQHFLDQSLGFDDFLDVLVFGLVLVGILPAASDAVSNLQ
jgi:hypothetical protein